MSELIVWTYDWVRQGPRGFVRDLRLRWACETDGELEMFESGAGLLHLARRSEKLMPRDPAGEAEKAQWMMPR